MKKDNRIKLTFKGLIFEMLTNEKAIFNLLNTFKTGVWLFGLATFIRSLAFAYQALHGLTH